LALLICAHPRADQAERAEQDQAAGTGQGFLAPFGAANLHADIVAFMGENYC